MTSTTITSSSYSQTTIKTSGDGKRATEQLENAILAGDEKRVALMLEKGANINLALKIAEEAIADKAANHSVLEKISKFLLGEASKQIASGLYKAIDKFENEVDSTGIKIAAGAEDEFYIHGDRAWTFDKDHEAEIRSKFPLIDIMYKEADAVLLPSAQIRLALPKLKKWEITTKHKNGQPISLKEQSILVNEIRNFLISKQKDWNLQFDFRSRPIPDLKKSVAEGLLPCKQTDAEVLESLKEQLISESYKENLGSGWRTSVTGDAKKHQETVAALEKIKTRVLAAKTFSELCAANTAEVTDSQIIASDCVPGNGVDINISAWKENHNLLFDKNEESKTSPLFWAFAHSYTRLIGKDTGSLTPSIQSYDSNTFDRMGKKHLAASAFAAVTQSKAIGGNLKRSPLTQAELNVMGRGRYAPEAQIVDEFNLRLERREGEPGGGLGFTNDLAQIQYCFTAALAVRNGLREKGLLANENGKKVESPSCPKSWEQLLQSTQPFNTSHQDALESFKASELLKEGYGTKLHGLVANHAELSLSLKAMQKDMAAGLIADKQVQRSVA